MVNPYELIHKEVAGKIFENRFGERYRMDLVKVSMGNHDKAYVEGFDLKTQKFEGFSINDLGDFVEISDILKIDEGILPAYGSKSKRNLNFYEMANNALSNVRLKSPQGIEYLIRKIEGNALVRALNIKTKKEENLNLNGLGSFEVIAENEADKK